MHWKFLPEKMSSLRIKIVLSLIGLSIFSVSLSGFSSRLVLSDSFENVVMVRSTIGFARDVVGYYRDHGSSFEQAHIDEPWASYLAKISLSRLQSPGGLEKAPAPEGGLEDVPATAYFIATDINGKVWVPGGSFNIGDTASENELDSALPILDNGITIAFLIVEGKLNLSGIETQYLDDLTNSLWVSFFLVALLAVPLGILMGQRLTSPINKLNNAVRALRPQTIYQSVPITSNDEIGSLSQSFNEMSQELASYVEVTEQQREKIAETETMRRQGLVSISHELRTPLYRLVSQAYAMLDGIRALDREEMTKLADSLDHLSELVNDLHHLALADVQAFSCDIKSTDFSLIILKAIEARKEVFAAKTFSLNTSIADKLLVDGDPTRLRQIIENLLSNCIRYTKLGGVISVELQSSGKFAELVVSDNGPGVPPENLEILFDRFYREESSRNRATGGAGLGLSLVKTCAEMHGGNAKAFSAKQGGLGICVQIPLHSSHQ